MIKLKSVSIKNFLSIGNVTQTIKLNDNKLTLILGENLDQGGNGSRNGTGKTTLIQAISFAFYGQPLTNIKRDNLINKLNQKNMVVSVEYESNGKNYKIERGRKPNFLKFYVDDGLVNEPDTDESHGESKWTQDEIQKTFGMSHNLFKHIVALHTKTIPFLSLKDKEQRDIIEELLGITQLTYKAERLKEQAKLVKDEIKEEEMRIRFTTESNERIQKSINDLNLKSSLWEKSKQKKLQSIRENIDILERIDIERELDAHKRKPIWSSLVSSITNIENHILSLDRSLNNNNSSIETLESQIRKAASHSCPTCDQELHTDKQTKIISDLDNRIKILRESNLSIENEILAEATKLQTLITDLEEIGDKPETSYEDIKDALTHMENLAKSRFELTKETESENPFFDQMANLTMTGLQEISYEYLDEINKLKDHQEFLLKLLTSRDSPIRKKIIDQNLNFLNVKLNGYLDKLQLPHEVIFSSDLTVEITLMGKDYDFEQLSNGEANRLVLALAWSFRDTWENMNDTLNILIIDELVDSGLDATGTDASLSILKTMVRKNTKNVFLISHKDGLESRVDNILLVQKENNFTKYTESEE